MLWRRLRKIAIDAELTEVQALVGADGNPRLSPSSRLVLARRSTRRWAQSGQFLVPHLAVAVYHLQCAFDGAEPLVELSSDGCGVRMLGLVLQD